MEMKERGWAWVVCFSLFLWNLIIGGTMKLQGVLFVEYQELFNASPAATGMISFTQGIMMTAISPIGGYLADKVPHNTMRLVVGVVFVMCAVCVALAGYMPSLPLTIFVFGGILGFFIGISDPPALAFLALYFEKLRTTAYGVSFTGNAIGSLLFPMMFAAMISYCGFRGAMLVFAGVWLHAVFLPITAWSVPDEKVKPRHLIVQALASNENDASKFETDSRASCEVQNEDSVRVSFIQGDTEQQGTDEISNETHPDGAEVSSGMKCTKAKIVCGEMLGIFKNYVEFLSVPTVPFLVLSILLGMFGYLSGYFIIPSIALEYGMTKWESSLVLSVASVSELIFNITVGLVVDRYRVSKYLVLLSSYGIAGALAMVASFVKNPYMLYVFGAVNAGIGGLVIVLAIPMMLDEVGESKKGTASGTFPLLSGLAAALTPVVTGGLYRAFGNYACAMIATSISFFLGIVLYFGTVVVKKLKAS